MRSKKEGQVTIFILLGLVILIVMLFLFVVSNRDEEPVVRQKDDSVGSYIRQCLYLTTESGLMVIGRQGGRLHVPAENLEMPYATLAFGFNHGQNRMPGLGSVKSDLQQYIEKNIMGCIGNFSDFPQYSITAGSDIHSDVTFADDNTISGLTIPIDIKKGSSTQVMDEFYADIPVRFRKVYDRAYRTMEELRQRQGMVNLTYQGQQDSDLYILTYNDSFVYVFEDPNSDAMGGPYRFILGVERDG